MLNSKNFIVGAIITAIVGYILLVLEYSIFIPETDVSKATKTVVNSIVTSESNAEEPSYDIEEFIEPDISELKVLLDIAKEINIYSIRNNEYSRLVDAAIRNDQYVKIIKHALTMEKFAIALSVAKKIDIYSIRNAQYQKILDAALIKR